MVEKMIERVPMTLEGHKNLEEELQRLKAVERPRIIAAISEARARRTMKRFSDS
jgi:transcription elongation factor GreA